MADTLIAPPVIAQSAEVTLSPDFQALTRDAHLANLLGTDYEYAKDSGLLDIFDYDPATGQDAILHILNGEVGTSELGDILAEGFHHEPSASHPDTRVDRTHLEGANKQHRRSYREVRWNPYKARVIVEGYQKYTAEERNGVTESVPAGNHMFPKEYDALTVLQAIRQAYENRDQASERASYGGTIISTGKALMLDGKTEMPITLCLDAKTRKIITAAPVSGRASMKLSRNEELENLGLLSEAELQKHLGAVSLKQA